MPQVMKEGTANEWSHTSATHLKFFMHYTTTDHNWPHTDPNCSLTLGHWLLQYTRQVTIQKQAFC